MLLNLLITTLLSNIEKNTEKKMAHSLKYLVNPTHKILKIKILLFGCLPMKIVQMLSMVH